MKSNFATEKKGKNREVKEILGDQVEVVKMKEAGVDCDPEENGSTFTENAYIKARAVREKCKASGNKELIDCIVMADDSGLEIDAMPGELGVKSARFMGHDTSYDIKNQAILDRMKDVPVEERGARFVCAIAAILPDGRELDTKGVMEGQIGYEISGNGGFGYDPIFYLPEYQASSADISAEEKNRISHRGQALRQMKELL